MSKWMNALLEEIDKNKSDVNPPMSALSAPFGGLLEKNYGVLDHKIENPYFKPMSALSAPFGGLLEKNYGVLDHKIENPYFKPMSALSEPFGGLLEKLEKNKSIGKLPMSVLSVVGKRVSLRFNNIIKNICNNLQTPADKTDIGSFAGEKYQGVDSVDSFYVSDIKNICNNLQTPADKTDIGSFAREKYQGVDSVDSFCVSDIKNICNNPQTPADKTDIGSFARKNSHLVDLSTSFANAIEITRTRNKPKQIRKSRWIAIVERLEVLVRDEKCHLLKMIEHGWSPEEVFGCHKSAPDARIDGMGLLMLLGSSRIAEIHPEKAALMFKSGSTTSYYLGAMNRNLSERSTLMEIE
jgi:acyl carrier protein